MKSASKIRNTYIELKRIFGDEYSEEHLHSLSIKIILTKCSVCKNNNDLESL